MEKQMNRGLRAAVLVVALAVLLGGAAFAYNALFASSKAGDVQSARTSPDTAGPGQGSASAPSHPLGGTRVGEAAVDFSLSDAEGRKVSLSAIRNGKPTVVNFWATWCPYCLREMEAFQSMYERYGDRVNFVMLNVADTSGEPDSAQAYVKEEGYTLPIYYDLEHAGSKTYNVSGLPATLVIGADATIRYKGAREMSRDDLAKQIEAAL